MCHGKTHLILTVDPELLEGGMSHGLSGREGCKDGELEGLHGGWFQRLDSVLLVSW
jgi:hypothetical protein